MESPSTRLLEALVVLIFVFRMRVQTLVPIHNQSSDARENKFENKTEIFSETLESREQLALSKLAEIRTDNLGVLFIVFPFIQERGVSSTINLSS